MIQEDKYYLIEDYLDELYIAKNIPYLMTKSKLNLKNFDNVIKECEEYDTLIRNNRNELTKIRKERKLKYL